MVGEELFNIQEGEMWSGLSRSPLQERPDGSATGAWYSGESFRGFFDTTRLRVTLEHGAPSLLLA